VVGQDYLKIIYQEFGKHQVSQLIDSHTVLARLTRNSPCSQKTIPPPLVPVSGGLGHVSHGRFQAEWAASLKGTLTFVP
jgi:hypothetical protein